MPEVKEPLTLFAGPAHPGNQVPAAGDGDGLPDGALPEVGGRGRGAERGGLEADHAAAPVAHRALERAELRALRHTFGLTALGLGWLLFITRKAAAAPFCPEPETLTLPLNPGPTRR